MCSNDCRTKTRRLGSGPTFLTSLLGAQDQLLLPLTLDLWGAGARVGVDVTIMYESRWREREKEGGVRPFSSGLEDAV